MKEQKTVWMETCSASRDRTGFGTAEVFTHQHAATMTHVEKRDEQATGFLQR